VTLWIAVLVVGAGSLALRLLPLHAAAGPLASDRGQRIAAHGGTAALAALVAGALLGPTTARPGGLVATVAGLVVGALVARRGAGLATVLALGLATYWITVAVRGLS
jgi:hypothetical protein